MAPHLRLALCLPTLVGALSMMGSMDRRALLQTSATALFSGATILPALPAHAISATTMAGKSKPELGVIMVDEAKEGSGGAISAELVLSGGIIASLAFKSPWALAEGNYYDVAAKSKDGDAAFVQVVDAGSKPLAKLPNSFFTNQILSLEGFWGSYGQPVDGKIKDVTAEGAASRTLELSFTPLGPSGEGSPRRAVVQAVQATGSSDVVMLVSSTTAVRWKKEGGEAAARSVANSFRVTATRPTALKQEASADFRYGKTSGPSMMKSRNDGF